LNPFKHNNDNFLGIPWRFNPSPPPPPSLQPATDFDEHLRHILPVKVVFSKED